MRAQFDPRKPSSAADYQRDWNNLQGQLADLKAQLAALQASLGTRVPTGEGVGQAQVPVILGPSGQPIAGTATSSTPGIVRVDPGSSDPIVYEKDSVDSLLTGKADTVHTHVKADITDFAHTHLLADVTDAGTAAGESGQTHTLPLAPLTGGGTQGSATFTNGVLTAHVDPT